MCDSILLGSFPDPDDLELELPGLSDLIRRCWREEPDSRPDSGELLASVERMKRENPGPTKPETSVKPSKAWSRLRRSVSLAAMPSPPASRAPVMHGRPSPPEQFAEEALQVRKGNKVIDNISSSKATIRTTNDNLAEN